MNSIKIKNQSLRIIFFIFSLFLLSGVTAQTTDKKITIQNKSISLKEAFALIEQQTGYSIAYEHSTLDLNKSISLSLKDASVDKALRQILTNTQHTYKINGYHIIILRSKEEKSPSKTETPNLTQTIRGVVMDSKTNIPVEFATVGLQENPSLSAATDSLGRFTIKRVPVGRYNIQTSLFGYQPQITNEIVVTSSKEVNLEILLSENAFRLDEVVVTPTINKEELINPMAIAGGRMINMEEAGRFANGFDDPARLVAAFAGVAGEIGSNALIVRGNSPQYTKWQLEGTEVPIPSHFADYTGLGGGFLSALNANVITNSDFYNGAFPAEYNNALAGVFDMRMRAGNNQRYEHSFLIGLMGMEFASEGPISKSRGSSYLFNLRASNTSLVTNGDANLSYEDMSFKLNFPTKRAGTFSVWGLGLLDRNKSTAEKDPSQWETMGDRRNGKDNLEKFMGGLTHKYIIDNRTSIQSSLVSTYSADHLWIDQIKPGGLPVCVADIKNRDLGVIASTAITRKFSPRHTNRTGIRFTHLSYDLNYQVSPAIGLDEPAIPVSKGNDNSTAWSAYTTSLYSFNQYLTGTVGLNLNQFSLTNEWSFEPRAALKWSPDDTHSLALAYGLHSQREKLNYYYVQKTADGRTSTNRDLEFTKAHHVSLSYNWRLSPNLNLKIEPYFQYLFQVPVEAGSTFSIINHQDYYLDRILTNQGAGRNYGVDVTLERYMKDGFYYMVSGSLFKSQYKGGDDVWRNTRYDRGFLLNLVAGKEWMVGKRKQNTFGINGRIFAHGGDRYTPIDETKSQEMHEIILDESKAYSQQFKPVMNGDLSINFRINKKKVSHEFSLKILNVGMRTGMFFYEYQENIREIKKENGTGLIPNLSYKIYF